jgi:hypothetical protein
MGRVVGQRTIGKIEVRYSRVIEVRYRVCYRCARASQAYFRRLRSPRNAILRTAFQVPPQHHK